ncbi:homeotic protein female sterile [Schistocerca cancellata]|uniref:homeotic protein female sterile n=1 Tax=Schistocerca cancellata TaxID=274614 RepID=UPI002119726E|nr:homeotic protein female sterile [Schistocerca cancellata]
MEERPVESVEEARLVIRELRDRYRAQAHQLLAWRRRVKQQEELFVRMARERAEQLKTLSAQLILFESRLCRKQKDLGNLLAQRDTIIARQQRTIQVLRSRLADAGLDCCESPPPGEASTNLDSLNDSDSAVIMEEGDGETSSAHGHGHGHGPSAHAHGHGHGQVGAGHAWHHGRYAGRSGGAVAVVRSVSDALEQPKYPSLRRSNGFLRRPEILETVYSVEEDGEGEQTNSPSPSASASASVSGAQAADSSSSADNAASGPEDAPDEDACSGRLQALYGSFERLHESPPTPQSPHHRVMTTYNRVMSNHRSVTKPKDVKYKRINKAKSKSLEELRGRLRNWVDKGNKLAVSLDQSYA